MLVGHTFRGGGAVTAPGAPATRQVVDLLGYGSPRWVSNGLTIGLAGFAVLALVRSFKLIASLQRSDATELGTLAAQGPAMFLVTLVLLCPFLVRANQNTRAFGETPEAGTLGLVGICLVPITNLFLPYFAVKDIWRNTRRGAPPPRWLSLWWWSLVFAALVPLVLLRAAQNGSGAALRVAAVILAGPGTVVALALSVAVVRGLAFEQVLRYEQLPPTFPAGQVARHWEQEGKTS